MKKIKTVDYGGDTAVRIVNINVANCFFNFRLGRGGMLKKIGTGPLNVQPCSMSPYNNDMEVVNVRECTHHRAHTRGGHHPGGTHDDAAVLSAGVVGPRKTSHL